jgi:hypothetical protein
VYCIVDALFGFNDGSGEGVEMIGDVAMPLRRVIRHTCVVECFGRGS